MDDWNFVDEQFTPFVGPSVERLLSLVIESDELETQTHVGLPRGVLSGAVVLGIVLLVAVVPGV